MNWNRKEQPEEKTPRIIEGEETALCGIKIEYKLDLNTGIVTENNIANQGTGKKTKHCARCQWRTICQPTPVRVEDITKEIVEIQNHIDKLKNDSRMSDIKAKIVEHYEEIMSLFDEAKTIRENDFIEIQGLIDQMNSHLQMVPENEL